MAEVKDDRQSAYIVKQSDARFEVCASSGRVIMVCADKASAQHYAALLSEAYKSGYKSGYKDGRNV